MESKYYTPDTIEEVFEQLIYNKEIYIKGGDDDIFLFKIRPNKLPTDIFNFLEITNKVVSNNKVEYDFSSDSFLIKYLDQQDIEDLGFKNITNVCKDEENNIAMSIKLPSTKHHGGGFRILTFNLDTKELKIFNDRVDEASWTHYGCLFQGIVNNKSELKKILQQVGIL